VGRDDHWRVFSMEADVGAFGGVRVVGAVQRVLSPVASPPLTVWGADVVPIKLLGDALHGGLVLLPSPAEKAACVGCQVADVGDGYSPIQRHATAICRGPA
jgi:hypothetical protein